MGKTDLEKLEIDDLGEKLQNISSFASSEKIYDCSLCHDTGWVVTEKGALLCLCRQKERLERKKSAAGLTQALVDNRFEDFCLDYYPEYIKTEKGTSYRALAKKALNAARDFSRNCAALYGKVDKKNPRQKAKNPIQGLLFEGEAGMGKTHLASAIANELLEKEVDVLFLVVPEFLDTLRFSYNNENNANEEELIKRAQSTQVLILDDLGAHNFSQWTRGKIFNLINYRLNHQLPCVITTNLSADELNMEIGSRTVSRIMEICDIYYLDSDKDIRLKMRHK